MPENADTVAITDSLTPDLLALLRLIYRVPQSTVHVVDSHAAVVAALRRFRSIRRLILMLEGNVGQLMVRRVLRSLKKYADDLAGTSLRIGEEIVFDGCNIALGCVEIAALMKVLHAPRATGFATYHVIEHMDVVVPTGGTDPKLIEKNPRYGLIRPFLLPGQSAATEIANRAGSHSLYYEYFTRRMKDGGGLVDHDLPFVYSRARLVQRTLKVDAVNDGQLGAAAALKSESDSLDTLGGAPFIVTLTDRRATLR
jgi:hypothetical protein